MKKENIQFCIQLFSQLSWIAGSVSGGLAGNLIPSSVTGIDYALTALFITIVVDQYRNALNHQPALIGGICSVFFLITLGSDAFLLPSLLVTSGLLMLFAKKQEVNV